MVKEEITVKVDSGFETRPIAMLVQLASQFRSEIHLESGTMSVNAKSIMGMMTLGIDNGQDVTVTADGADETDALDRIKTYLTQGS